MDRNLMEVARPIKKPTKIIIGKDATLKQRLMAIFFGPLLLAVCFLKIHYKEYGSFVPSSDYILACSVLAFPFVVYISYKWYRNLGIKVILTDQKVIKKPLSGRVLHFDWREIKKIYFTVNPKNENEIVSLIFTRKKRYRPFDKKNYIFCSPGPMSKENGFREAADLILKKIDKYKISVKGDRAILEEIVRRSANASQTTPRPATPLKHQTGNKHLPVGSSSSQTPAPK